MFPGFALLGLICLITFKVYSVPMFCNTAEMHQFESYQPPHSQPGHTVPPAWLSDVPSRVQLRAAGEKGRSTVHIAEQINSEVLKLVSLHL